MATMAGLLKRQDEIISEIYRRKSEAESSRTAEFRAVVRVQAWFRAQRVRSYMKHLNKCATAVQRRWRGYLGRKAYRDLVKNQVFIMKLNHYNAMATKIQKVWRGYYTRKYIFNYYSRKRYLEGLVIKNEIVRTELQDYAEQQAQLRQWKKEEEDKKKQDYLARKNHYLLSTEVLPGIYNSPYQPYPSEVEFYLRNARPLTPKKMKASTAFDPTGKKYDLPRRDPLPPVKPKPQGPFRDPRDVQKQRYKTWQPTLRVATSYTSVEEAREKMKQFEWVTRLNDNIFVPFSRKSVPYDPLLHTTSKYGHLPYGTNYFREEFPDRFVVSQNFQTVVPPIPILEKLNDTYSQGQV